MRRVLRSRYGGLILFGLIFLAVSFLLRTTLLIQSISGVDLRIGALCKSYLVGLFFDLVVYFYCMVPGVLFLLLATDRMLRSKVMKVLVPVCFFLGVGLLLFDAGAEWLFWEEFGIRYNFVAVDYMIYTQEVVGNIRESYPVPAILGAIALVAGLATFFSRKYLSRCREAGSTFGQRLKPAAVFLAIPLLAWPLVDQSLASVSKNQYMNELAKNGLFSFVTALNENQIEYDRFYRTQDNQAAFGRMRELLQADNATFAGTDPLSITRRITNPQPEKRSNVVILVIESLSGEYVGALGDSRGLTPTLDGLASQSLFFTRCYATGTRTDRGLEAISLSIPPTPGRSVLKRQARGAFLHRHAVPPEGI